MTDPYPKSRQLARGERRYRRKIASPKQWQAIVAAKLGECRVCCDRSRIAGHHLHHLVPRSRGGDDVADNIVPLCPECHDAITRHKPLESRELAESLTDAEYAYVIGKLGEGALERLFGVARLETEGEE